MEKQSDLDGLRSSRRQGFETKVRQNRELLCGGEDGGIDLGSSMDRGPSTLSLIDL